MATEEGMTCIDCHGDIAHVATNANPWLNEPRCDSCHDRYAHQTRPLYRFSRGHGGVYCEGCHDSTHAIAVSREPKDAIKFIALQGHAGALSQCTVCHTSTPPGDMAHAFQTNTYIPVVNK
jgi:nitrate/TMAO reductase-like tetraheme cytochrome c subunit